MWCIRAESFEILKPEAGGLFSHILCYFRIIPTFWLGRSHPQWGPRGENTAKCVVRMFYRWSETQSITGEGEFELQAFFSWSHFFVSNLIWYEQFILRATVLRVAVWPSLVRWGEWPVPSQLPFSSSVLWLINTDLGIIKLQFLKAYRDMPSGRARIAFCFS